MRRQLPDYLRPGLDIVFVGINPGQWAMRLGHYYANPRNNFWHFLRESFLTTIKLDPREDKRVLEFGLGLTDRVKRGTRSASELKASDFKRGAMELHNSLEGRWPCIVAFNGKIGLKWILGHAPARYGRQAEPFGSSRVFVVPSTSPANARLSPAKKLEYFRDLAEWRTCLQGDNGRRKKNGKPC